IGNYTSQYFGNFYLSWLDHWIKETIHLFTTSFEGVTLQDTRKVLYYLRYMDDMIIFSDSKEFLHQLRKDIEEYIYLNLKLHLKSNWQIFPTYIRGVDFVGYRCFKQYTLLRNTTKKRLKRTTKKLYNKLKQGGSLSYKNCCTLCSYKGILIWCDSYRLSQSTIQRVKNAV
ncbi:MAG: RNA-directed DNA polymerase, partial [Clostridium sp.]